MMGKRVDSGFTLVELMVVIVIIGLLAAIAIPNFVRVVNKSKEAEVESNMHTVQFEVELYQVDHFALYPANAAIIRPNLPRNIKNPFNPSDPALQDASAADIEGVVEYKSDIPNDAYTITGIGKGPQGLSLTLISGGS